MKIYTILILISILFLYGKPSFKLDLESKVSIDINSIDERFITFGGFYIDNSDNLFIVEGYKQFIVVVSPEGKVLNRFGAKGSGPVEFSFINGIGFFDREIVLGDMLEKKFTFIDSKEYKHIKYLPFFNRQDYVINFFSKGFIGSKFNIMENRIDGSECFIYNFERDQYKKLKQFSFDIKGNGRGNFAIDRYKTPKQATDEIKYIYLFQQSCSKYEISMYDIEGNFIKNISRRYRNIPFSKHEKEIRRMLGAEKRDKFSIYNIFADNGYLLVNKATHIRREEDQSKFYVDIYKDGEFIEETILDFIDGFNCWHANNSFKIKNGKIYIFNGDENILDIYKYEITE
ncbi:MAG: hypothetical protein CR982_02945 [Candidatus Cloacimonadota bacterium]|nr:MAG: hypothetical protein CR982_02945 [Candidatus Cloacimonadota bacterium]PIE82023.1 MAG: hypothetical protein CSA15_00135 [Candidatus Delongbacteria bacterium]